MTEPQAERAVAALEMIARELTALVGETTAANMTRHAAVVTDRAQLERMHREVLAMGSAQPEGWGEEGRS